MNHFIIPENYHPALNLYDTQVGIKTVKDFFQKSLSEQLNLLRVSCIRAAVCGSGFRTER